MNNTIKFLIFWIFSSILNIHSIGYPSSNLLECNGENVTGLQGAVLEVKDVVGMPATKAGDVLHVQVRCDDTYKVTFEVNYTGYDEHHLTASLVDEVGCPIDGFPIHQANITNFKEKILSLIFSVSKESLQDSKRTPYLALIFTKMQFKESNVCRASLFRSAKVYRYKVFKKWGRSEQERTHIARVKPSKIELPEKAPKFLRKEENLKQSVLSLQDTTAKGPSQFCLDLRNFIVHSKLTSSNGHFALDPRLYKDQNPNSNTYYYIPRAYYLDSDSVSRKYKISRQFRPRSGVNENKQVVFHVTLANQIDEKELYISKRILETYFIKNGLPKPKLLIMPLNETPEVLLTGLQQLSDATVYVSNYSNLSFPVNVGITLSRKRADNLFNVLTNGVNIQGKIVIKPASSSMPALQLPVYLNPGKKEGIGKLRPNLQNWRDHKWENSLPYPIRVKGIKAMLLLPNESRIPQVTSVHWKLNDLILQPKDVINWDLKNIPAWLDDYEHLLDLWLDYEIQLPCIPCHREALGDIIINKYQSKEIEVLSTDLFAKSGAAKILLQIHSSQGVLSPMEMNVDHQKFTYPDPIYLSSDDLSYNYRVTLIMPNGEQKESGWIMNDQPYIYLGSSLLPEIESASKR